MTFEEKAPLVRRADGGGPELPRGTDRKLQRTTSGRSNARQGQEEPVVRGAHGSRGIFDKNSKAALPQGGESSPERKKDHGKQLPLMVFSVVNLSVLQCSKHNGDHEEENRTYGSDAGKNRFVTAALFLSEQLLGTSADGTGKTGAVSGLEKNACRKNDGYDDQNHH